MSLVERYLEIHDKLVKEVAAVNAGAIAEAAVAIGESLGRGGVLHVFGSGHSGIIAQEIVHRAGGLVPVSAITDPTGGWSENIVGYGSKLLQRYRWTYGIEADEVVIVISNSGKNPGPIEVALGAKDAGARVIGVTSMPMSADVSSAHPCGKRLFEIADIVLDNRCVTGDATLDVPGQPARTAPMSTVSGCLLLNLLVVATIEYMAAQGYEIPLLRSGNLPGGKEFNDRISERYRKRLSRPI